MHPALTRRSFALGALGTLGLGTLPVGRAQDSPRVGAVIMHGKNPGRPQDLGLIPLRTTLERQGWHLLVPEMPWSRGRYLEGSWDSAMAEVAAHVKTLLDNGAQRIVLIGHSMGCPAAMSHAARGGRADALVLLAPGHTPMGYYTIPQAKTVRDSIDEARAAVAAGRGDAIGRFQDINQGRQQVAIATARNYLSFFDPQSEAEMSVTAPKLPPSLPVLTAIGERDPLFSRVRSYYVDSLPKNPQSQLLEVSGGHLDTPRIAADQVVAWIKAVV